MNNTQARPRIESNNPDTDLMPTAPVIERVEKLDDWLEHREIVIQELCPVGAIETLYAQRAAIYLWRLDRLIGYENAENIREIDARWEKYLEDSQEERVNRVLPEKSTLQTIIKYEAHLNRCLSSTMAELRRLQKERRQGLRDVIPRGRGADRAGVCHHEQLKAGSPGGSPSQTGSPTQTGSPSLKNNSAEMSIPGGRGADRAGVCQNQQIKDGSPGGSPSQKSSPSQKCSPNRTITGAEMSISGGRGADQAGVFEHQQIKDGSPGGSPSQTGSPTQTGSPSQKCSSISLITGAEMSNRGGRGADRAGDFHHQQLKDGSPGGSPSQKSSPSQKCSPNRTITGAEMSNPGGRGADRAGVFEHQQIKDGSPGGSPSQKSSPSQKCSPNRTITGVEMSNPGGRCADRAGVCKHQQIKDGSPGGSPSRKVSPVQQSSPLQMVSPMRTGSGKQRNSASRKRVSSQRASQIPNPPPLLESITNRRRLEEYTRGEIFERNLASATLDFAMIPYS